MQIKNQTKKYSRVDCNRENEGNAKIGFNRALNELNN